MPKFTPRTVVVEARQVTEESAADVAAWCGGDVVMNYWPEPSPHVKTLLHGTGVKPAPRPCAVRIGHFDEADIASIDWWVVRGIVGDFQAVRPEHFTLLYEDVPE